MMFWRKKKRIDPAELIERAEAASRKIVDQQPRVDANTTFLERRKLQNGFGEDFEYTLKPRGAQ